MRVAIAFLLSWITVTIIYAVALWDEAKLSFSEIVGSLLFMLGVGMFVFIYFVVIGLPILYALMRRKAVNRLLFTSAGLIACVPMLIVFVASGDIEWIITTLIAGVAGGYVFALLLCNQFRT